MGSKEKHRSRPIQQKKKERRWPGRKVWLACACCAGLVLCIAIAVFLLRTNQMLPVASIAGHTVNQAELQYYYVEEIADYQEQVSRYGSEYELNIDFTQPLSQQNCPLTSGISWHTYFMEKALARMGIAVDRWINISNTLLHNPSKKVITHIKDYAKYNMGATAMFSIDKALEFAKKHYDGIIHVKSFGCTPEIDAMPVLQNISNDYKIPILYFSFDSQTSETGIQTRLEAFYDMIVMRKEDRK